MASCSAISEAQSADSLRRAKTLLELEALHPRERSSSEPPHGLGSPPDARRLADVHARLDKMLGAQHAGEA